jgi:phosphodiesterase/alkaline phosphatase D-like protein
MSRELKAACLVLALGTFALAEQPRTEPITGQSQQQNQRTNVEITQQPRVENASDNSATIAWTTNVQAGTRVRYGTDRNGLSQTATAPWGGITHRVELKNLRPNTTYYYQVISEHASGSGTSATGDIGQFRTSGNGQQAQYGQPGYRDNDRDRDRNNNSSYNQDRDHDRDNDRYRDNRNYGSRDNVDIIAGPVIQNLTPNAATLWWQTDSTAANDVVYGTDPNNLNQRAYERGGSKDHTAELDNLQPGRNYYYKILRRDGSVRTTGQFGTPGRYGDNRGYNQNYPQQGQYDQGQYNQGRYNQGITNGPIIETIGPNNATIAWTTNAQSSSIVRYGTDPNSLTQTAQGAWSSAGHRVTLNNLRPNTRYFFEVISTQAPQRGGATMASNPGQFQTLSPGQSAMTIRQPQY